MMTDKQLITLLHFIEIEAARYSMLPSPDHEVRSARKDCINAFGFDADKRGRIVPPTNLATSDPEGRRQAIADADYHAKEDAIAKLLTPFNTLPYAAAKEIMRLWPELKAIMEPGNA